MGFAWVWLELWIWEEMAQNSTQMLLGQQFAKSRTPS